jgi:hypothetical protein
MDDDAAKAGRAREPAGSGIRHNEIDRRLNTRLDMTGAA